MEEGTGQEEIVEVEPQEIKEPKLKLIDPMNDLLKRAPAKFDFEKADPIQVKEDLLEAMEWVGGVGLSANQVGLDMAVFVIGDGQEEGVTKAFYNPEIVGCSKDEDVMKEGCLSFPGLWLMVKRPKQVVIKYYDEDNEEKIETYEGVAARVILHEYDHMLGANFTMRVSKLKLERAFKALEKKIKKHQRRMKHTRLT